MARYSSRSRLSVSDGGERARRAQAILILILIAGLAVTVFMLVPAMNYRTEAHSDFMDQMWEECKDAVSRTEKLSNNGASDSYSSLAVIRSEVRVMDTLMGLDARLSGKPRMVESEVFTRLYASIDSYYTTLITNGGTSISSRRQPIYDDLMIIYQTLEATR